MAPPKLAALVLVLLASASLGDVRAEEEPPLFPGREIPVPLDALIADTPLGPLPFPGPRFEHRHRSAPRRDGPPPRSWLPWLFPEPPPPHPHPHPHPHPPPPGAVELAVKLLAAVGSGLEAFYANKTSAAAIAAGSHTCGYCVGNETEKLVGAVEEAVTSLCASVPDKAQEEEADLSLEPLKHFCELYPKLRTVTALALLSKMKTNPLSLAITRCAADGPCNLIHAGLISSSSEFAAEVLTEGGDNVTPKEDRPSPLFDMGLDINTDTACQDCIVSGFQLVKEVVEAKFDWVCSNAKCHRIQAMCNFTKEHPYLTMVGVVLKLKPWRKVVPGCFFIGACQPPPSPPGPPPPLALKDVYPLPIFPALDIDIFAPPPAHPPAPGACLMGFFRRIFGWPNESRALPVPDSRAVQ